MAVLTWQNVDGPRQGYGAPSIDRSLDAMNNGFKALQGVNQSFTDAANANFDNQKEQNTGAMINALANISDIGEFDKQHGSGAFSADNLKAQFGGAFDYNKFNAALMARRGQIQQDTEGQLKLNEDTDYQKNQGKMAYLMGLANTDTAAYNKAIANTDLGAAAGLILGKTNPLMNDTRSNNTTMRGQDLTHADNQARIGLDRDRFNYDKSQDAKKEAKLNTDGAFAVGQNYAVEALKNKSQNDAVKFFTGQKEFLAMDPAHQKAALDGISATYQRGSQMTDKQQDEYTAAVTPTNNLSTAIDNKISTIRSNNALQNPNYLYMQGAEGKQDMSVADATNDMFKDTKYNDRGEIADHVTELTTKYRLNPADIASIAKNAVKSSGIRLGGFVRGDTTYDWDKLDQAAAEVAAYKQNGGMFKDQQAMAAITAPADQFKKDRDRLLAEYKRAKAANQDVSDLERRMKALNDRGALIYNQVSAQGDKFSAAVANSVPKDASDWYYKGMTSTYRQ